MSEKDQGQENSSNQALKAPRQQRIKIDERPRVAVRRLSRIVWGKGTRES